MLCYIRRMNASQSGIWQGLLNVLTDPATISAIGGIITIAATALSKSLRNWVTLKLKKIKQAKRIHELEGHAIPAGYAETSMRIVTRLGDLRDTIDCSRVAILQFRNGSMFTLSSPMFRVYGSYESIRNGVAPSNNYFKELLGTNLPELLTPLFTDSIPIAGTTIIKDACPIQDCPNRHSCPRVVKYEVGNLPYSTFRFMLEEAGIKFMYAVLLKSGNNPIGIMVMHYLAEEEADRLIIPNMHEICETANYVQNILDIRRQAL